MYNFEKGVCVYVRACFDVAFITRVVVFTVALHGRELCHFQPTGVSHRSLQQAAPGACEPTPGG